MAIAIFMALCFAAEGFLIYAFVQFVRESRRSQIARRSPSGNTPVAPRKVIEINISEGHAGRAKAGQQASMVGRRR